MLISLKIAIISLFLGENIFCGTHWKRLNETLPMSTQKISLRNMITSCRGTFYLGLSKCLNNSRTLVN